MNKEATILQWSLRGGAIYFTCIALAHSIGVKVPGLFIYFNVPSHAYQDHIIAFLATGWAVFYFVASIKPQDNPLAVTGVVLSSAVAIVGLMRINLLDDLVTLSPGVNVNYFWWQTIILALYVSWLLVFQLKSRRADAIV